MSNVSENSDWKKLQHLQLMSLLKLRDVCKKYDVNYSLIFGTLLGAVRHKGFIPWDDDVDVAMLRSDFDKFLSIPREEFGDAFFIQNYESDAGYPSPLIKIRVNDTLSVQKSCSHVDNMHHGVWIDIFPYDNSPNSKLGVIFHEYVLRYLELLLYYNSGYYRISSERRFLYVVFSLVKHIPHSLLQKLYFKTMTMFNKRNTDYVAPTTSVLWYPKDRYLREDLLDLIDVEFEGYLFKAPRRFHEILSKTYGDYMSLPPIEKRTTNIDMFSLVSFGKYSDISTIEEACRIAGLDIPKKM